MVFLASFIVFIVGLAITISGIVLFFIRDKYNYPPSITYAMMGFGVIIILLSYIVNSKEEQRMSEYLAQQNEIETKKKDKEEQDERLKTFTEKANKEEKIRNIAIEKEKKKIKENADKEVSIIEKEYKEFKDKKDSEKPPGKK